MKLIAVFLVVFLARVQAEDSIFGLYIKGNQFYNEHNQAVRLRGVSHSGTEYACVQGWGMFDGPVDNSSITSMKSWNINIVRIPVNEDCWLSLNGVKSQYSGANYQNAINDYVIRLNQHNIAVVIDLHWTAPSNKLATGQNPMPDRDHSINFWKSAASYFSNNSAVIFDLFNEPYPDSNRDTTSAWSCWQNGGSCSGMSYQAAGMQDLVNAVRGTGARNIVVLGGVEYSNSLTGFLSHMPNDPLNQLGASWHSYNFNRCNSKSCWDNQIAPVQSKVPVLVTEFGENDCATGYVDPLMDWMDTKGMSYLGWTWNTWDCKSGPALIKDYSGTPTNYGKGLYDRLTQ